MCHQVIAFNPDECDINGGKMTPARCMEFAREWVEGRYPDQEAVWVLHRERCAADGTRRYAVHVGINRTNLETGRRLNEGRSKQTLRAAGMLKREKAVFRTRLKSNGIPVQAALRNGPQSPLVVLAPQR